MSTYRTAGQGALPDLAMLPTSRMLSRKEPRDFWGWNGDKAGAGGPAADRGQGRAGSPWEGSAGLTVTR